MNCKPGDLAYVVVPAGFDPLLDGRAVEVGVDGECDNETYPHPDFVCWMCRFPTPWVNDIGNLVRQCWVRDAWLRPISGVPVHNEQHDEVAA